MSYIGFDKLADRFARQIYGTLKGRVRQAVLESLYADYLPAAPMRALDAGGGLGQMSAWLLAAGHRVDYLDVSTEMVARTGEALAEQREAGLLRLHQASLLEYEPAEPPDLVVVHAVLEWLEEPEAGLERCLGWVQPGGWLGLMVYNRHLLELRNLMRGNLDRVRSGNLAGDGRGLTPISPLEPARVRRQLEDAGFEVLTQAGIRTFTDLTEATVLSWYQEADVIAMERRLCEQAPYRDLGRYVLFLARRG